MRLTLEIVYRALNYHEWRIGKEIKYEIAFNHGLSTTARGDDNRIQEYLSQHFPEIDIQISFFFLPLLIAQDLAQSRIRPPTSEEVERYTQRGLDKRSGLWKGRNEYLKKPNGRIAPQRQRLSGLESLVPA
ncbi:hypothetical protein HYV86_03305 [Candidatus Woesearchaeota archaeon]|nr:hypothetical protein [Candidatus Woesearchaeota archaeon]